MNMNETKIKKSTIIYIYDKIINFKRKGFLFEKFKLINGVSFRYSGNHLNINNQIFSYYINQYYEINNNEEGEKLTYSLTRLYE